MGIVSPDLPRFMLPDLRKSDLVNVEHETRARNLLKGELKRRGVTYAQLAEKLGASELSRTNATLLTRSAGAGSLRRSCCNA
jgi:hypothetical protein